MEVPLSEHCIRLDCASAALSYIENSIALDARARRGGEVWRGESTESKWVGRVPRVSPGTASGLVVHQRRETVREP